MAHIIPGGGQAGSLGSIAGTSEFVDGLMQTILSDLYTTAYEGCQKLFNGLFDSLNSHVSEAANSLVKTPQAWNASAYGTVRDLSRAAFLSQLRNCTATLVSITG